MWKILCKIFLHYTDIAIFALGYFILPHHVHSESEKLDPFSFEHNLGNVCPPRLWQSGTQQHVYGILIASCCYSLLTEHRYVNKQLPRPLGPLRMWRL